MTADFIPNERHNKKPTVLVASPYFYPGYKAGGALRSVVNIIRQLNDLVCFKVITRDRDAFDTNSYPDVKVGEWQKVFGADVFYINSDELNLTTWKNLLNSTQYDVLYLNSFFSPRFTIYPLILARTGQLKNSNILLAPRGELAKSALGLKSIKKSAYLKPAKLVGLLNGLTFQGSSDNEMKDIKLAISSSVKVNVVENLPSIPPALDSLKQIKKKSGDLKLLFFSRLSPVKNLDGALDILMDFEKRCDLFIYGPIGDQNFWDKCQSKIQRLPSWINVDYRGVINNSEIAEAFESAHYLFLPTLGENFGHVIFESLSHGTPVIISDQTIWKSLKTKQIGWDLSLSKPQEWRVVLELCYLMNGREYEKMSVKSNMFARNYLKNSELVAGYLKMFSAN